MNTEDKSTAILYITDGGRALAQRLQGLYHDAFISRFRSEAVAGLWERYGNLIFIMATGIVVRTLAPLIRDKRTDPAVVVIDEKGESVISLLSGHLGGANNLAKEIADFIGGKAVITTASDINALPSIDLWAKENGLVIEDWGLLPRIGTRLVNDGAIRVFAEVETGLPAEFERVGILGDADVLITNKIALPASNSPILPQLFLRPMNLIIGIGCNSGTSKDEIGDAVRTTLEENNLSFLSIRSVATIDKKASEEGLLSFAGEYRLPIDTFTARELNSVPGIRRSEAAIKAMGAKAVAEPAALLASEGGRLLVSKQKKGNVTVAIAERKAQSAERRETLGQTGTGTKPGSLQKGKIFVVGTGPGSAEHLTPYALNAIRSSDAIVGYGTYLRLIEELIKDKEVLSTGMTQEVDRCRKAVELALSGKTVSVISGGDPGIYAMAGLVFEILRAEEQKSKRAIVDEKEKDNSFETTALLHYCTAAPDVEIVPGISALNACAARLGAPLMHDFACISLSDRLTPWELIEKRLEAAAAADFVIVLYNPKSKGRVEQIGRAREIILKHRGSGTPVGIVKGAMRDDETVVLTDLGTMLDHDIDMQTTVIIGNSHTFIWEGRMITPRGYEKKGKL